ncbi:hypothetical protein L1049_005288 [Liquidambar formosana]|uniref:KIB1-4 beta-propeller domain-containing protein n=1 Tax=Liquidambar formosana TaxID=63359 RepID=A0AAP0WZ43_LIQFO
MEQWRPGPVYIRRAVLLSPVIVTDITSTASDPEAAWTDLDQRLPILFEDIIWYNGQLYAVDNYYDLILFELGLRPRGTRLNLPCPAGYDRDYRKGDRCIYSVESCGELLMVVKTWNCNRARLPNLPRYVTTTFAVFKLNPRGHCWIKVESLGDRMLFVGASNGISVSASYFLGFKGNCKSYT